MERPGSSQEKVKPIEDLSTVPTIVELIKIAKLEEKLETRRKKGGLEIKYYSQYLDVSKKLEALTSCGAVCFYMIVKTLLGDRYQITLDELIKKGTEDGGYKDTVGWIHDYFINQAKLLGLDAYRKNPVGMQYLMDKINEGYYCITSCTRLFLDEPVSTHLVVLTGFDDNGFYFVDPASTDKTQQNMHRYRTFAKFDLGYNSRAMFIRTGSGAIEE